MKVVRNLALILFVVSFVFLPSNSVFSASLKQLEKEIAELKRISAAQSKNLATALNQVQEILSEFQGMYGKVDQSLAGNRDQTKLIKDNQTRLNSLEDRISILMEQFEEIKTAGLLSPEQTKKFKEFQVYQRGLAKVNAEEYKGAIQTFKSFMAKNPKSTYVSYAQYWIGESYYSMKDFPAAVTEFQKVIKKYPKSKKIPPSLLKQGYSFYEMQAFEDAKAFLSKLVSRYPRSNEAILARGKIKRINELLAQKAKEAVERQTIQ